MTAVAPRRGVWIFPDRPAGELVAAIVAAEEAGLDEVWLADEGVARTPFEVLAAAAIRTTTIRLATGVTSPLLRHPGAIGASIATIDELSGGRAVLGLGVGGALSLDPFGLTAERPVARLRDAIVTCRAVLEGRAGGGYAPPGHAMPARAVPVWVGARGEQLVRVAVGHADGLFLSGCSPGELDAITANAEAAGGTQLALYRSVRDRPSRESEIGWDAATAALAGDLARWRPAAIGIDIVDTIGEPRIDLPAAVARAAEVLAAV